MNIKITKEEAQELFERESVRFVIGSYLYGTNTDKSDKDILVIYKSFDPYIDHCYAVQHQFQYTDISGDVHVDYIFCTKEQFIMNMLSGDSTINLDVVFFHYKDSDALINCRTYNIIKACLGFAKRDISLIGKSKKDKMFHAKRSLYMAEKLLDNEFPTLENIKSFKGVEYNIEELTNKCNELRHRMNKEYQANTLPRFYYEYNETLHDKLIQSVNTKEFKYDE